MVCCRWTAPLLLLAVLYLGVVITIQFAGPECLDEPCGSEGVDNSIMTWGGMLFVAFCLLGFAFHLLLSTTAERAIRKSGILAQIFMAGSFALNGICHWLYANNGSNDGGMGMQGFWIVKAVGSFFFALSAFSHAQFATGAATCISTFRKPCCSHFFLQVFHTATILSCTSLIAGCVGCATSSNLHVDNIMDNYESDHNHGNENKWIQLVTVSETIMWLAYGFLWIPMGLLLKSAARPCSQELFGLSSKRAAGSAILLQWTMGSMFLVFLSMVAWIRGDELLELSDQVHAAEVFNIGTLLTFYCSHNLSWVLTLPTHEKKGQCSKMPGKGEPNESKSLLACQIERAKRKFGSKKMGQSTLASNVDEAEKGIAQKANTDKSSVVKFDPKAIRKSALASSVGEAEKGIAEKARAEKTSMVKFATN